MLPAALRPGDHVRIVAPSGPFDRERFDRGVARLRERYRVTFDESIFARAGYLAGDDSRRLAELLAAIRDPSVDAIVAGRGGYGATRLLDAIDPREVSARPKLLIGFSDITALHALWARAGVRSIHGSMAAFLSESKHLDRWIAVAEGATPDPLKIQTIANGKAQGLLRGGNLAVLHAMCGTPYAPPLEGAILFIEDVGEAPYRVDRMLTTLRQAGWLEQIAGIAIGAFTDCAPREDGLRVDDVFVDRLSDLGVPVASGVPSGHVDDNLELPFGAPVELDTTAGTLVFLEPAGHRADSGIRLGKA
jgi:muramoyltetrapeptide carboxypeptidase